MCLLLITSSQNSCLMGLYPSAQLQPKQTTVDPLKCMLYISKDKKGG